MASEDLKRSATNKRQRQPIRKPSGSSNVKFDLGSNDAVDGSRYRQSVTAIPSKNYYSFEYFEAPHFLRACARCRRRLVPCRDIYMYRGDSPFCSAECRQQQMNEDERIEKCRLASSKEVSSAASASGQAEAVAAVK